MQSEISTWPSIDCLAAFVTAENPRIHLSTSARVYLPHVTVLPLLTVPCVPVANRPRPYLDDKKYQPAALVVRSRMVEGCKRPALRLANGIRSVQAELGTFG